MNINEPAKEVHEVECKNGKWDKPASKWDMLLKLARAAQYVKTDNIDAVFNKCLNREEYERLLSTVSFDATPRHTVKYYEPLIKGSWDDHLAKVMIELLSIANATGVDLEFHVQARLDYDKYKTK